MFLMHRNGLYGNQDTITLEHIKLMATALSSNNEVDPQFIMGCNPNWSITKGAYIYQGARLNGDSAPWWWSDDLSNPGTILTDWWNAINMWAVVFVHKDNTTTNAAVALYDAQLYVLLESTGQWTRIDNSNGRPQYPHGFYALNDLSTAGYSAGTMRAHPATGRAGWNNVPTSGDWAASSSDTAKYRIAHNALIPPVAVDGSDVIGVFATLKAHTFSLNGNALNGTTKLYLQVGSDIKPTTSSTLNSGALTGVFYWPGCGAGNLIQVPADGSSVRVSFCTVGGSGFSTNIDGANDSVYGANNQVYLTHAEIAANLPILKFNTTL